MCRNIQRLEKKWKLTLLEHNSPKLNKHKRTKQNFTETSLITYRKVDDEFQTKRKTREKLLRKTCETFCVPRARFSESGGPQQQRVHFVSGWRAKWVVAAAVWFSTSSKQVVKMRRRSTQFPCSFAICRWFTHLFFFVVSFLFVGYRRSIGSTNKGTYRCRWRILQGNIESNKKSFCCLWKFRA